MTHAGTQGTEIRPLSGGSPMSRVGERQAHLWGTALHPSQADGKGGRWTEWERDSATWYNLEAALECGSHPTGPASDYSPLWQDVTMPGTKNGSLVATGPELTSQLLQSPTPTHKMPWLGPFRLPRLSHVLGPRCLSPSQQTQAPPRFLPPACRSSLE